jgi:hypothetical protein
MKLATKSVAVLAASLVLVGLGAVGADAASRFLATSMYVQEKSNWCWVAASKTIVKYHTNQNPSQCTVYKWGKGGSTCPDQTGTFGNVAAILLNAGFSSYGTNTTGAISYQYLQNEINISRPILVRWGWNSTGGSTGHMVTIRGFNTTNSIVSYVNPLNSTNQSNTYNWMKSGGGHTWSHTKWEIFD